MSQSIKRCGTLAGDRFPAAPPEGYEMHYALQMTWEDGSTTFIIPHPTLPAIQYDWLIGDWVESGDVWCDED